MTNFPSGYKTYTGFTVPDPAPAGFVAGLKAHSPAPQGATGDTVAAPAESNYVGADITGLICDDTLTGSYPALSNPQKDALTNAILAHNSFNGGEQDLTQDQMKNAIATMAREAAGRSTNEDTLQQNGAPSLDGVTPETATNFKYAWAAVAEADDNIGGGLGAP